MQSWCCFYLCKSTVFVHITMVTAVHTKVRISCDRNALICIGEGSDGIEFSETDLEMITTHGIHRLLRQTTQAKYHHELCDRLEKRG